MGQAVFKGYSFHVIISGKASQAGAWQERSLSLPLLQFSTKRTKDHCMNGTRSEAGK